MYGDRIGIHTPADLGELIHQRLPLDDTGMVYDVHFNADEWDNRFIVGAWHVDVGQVTWYYYDPTDVRWRAFLLATFPMTDND